MRDDYLDVIGWPHAHVYVLPCGHGLLICNSQSHCGLVHVSFAPA